jgi:hypothetical protein
VAKPADYKKGEKFDDSSAYDDETMEQPSG